MWNYYKHFCWKCITVLQLSSPTALWSDVRSFLYYAGQIISHVVMFFVNVLIAASFPVSALVVLIINRSAIKSELD